MLRLIEAGFTAMGEEELNRLIAKSVGEMARGYLFVPEQQTLARESIMADLLPPSSNLHFEVTNFTRFTNTAFRTLGGITGEYCDNSTRALVMWRTLCELGPMLNLTRAGALINSGTVNRALGAVMEMQALGVTPEEIEAARTQSGTDSSLLYGKLMDISLIYSLYHSLMDERYSDIYQDTVALAQKIESSSEFLHGASIFIDGFTSFTEPQYKLIGALIKHADVTVRLTLPSKERERFEFTELMATHRRLIGLADAAGATKLILRPDTQSPNRPEILGRLADLLWKTNGELDTEILETVSESGGRVRIFAADTPFEECDYIAADIKKRVMAGAKYTDFAIIARNTDSYQGILDLSLDNAQIPYFFSKKKELDSFEGIKLINTAYAICARGFAREEVLTYLKCGLSSITRDEGDLFENYVLKWGIDGARFKTCDEWTMNPRGYEPMTEEDALKLARINEIKDRLILPLEKFKDAVAVAKTVREHAEALIGFLVELDLEKNLYERASQLALLGEGARAEENSRLWRTICNGLDKLVAVLDTTPATAESFISQLGVVLSKYGMSMIPAHIDEVTIGSADMIRLSGKAHVYLIGVNDGEFPRTVNDDSYFTDREKIALNALGLSWEPDLDIKGARELYAFSRAFTSATETVTLTYSRRSAAMAPILPSAPIERIKNLTRGIVTPINISSLPIREKLYSTDMAYELFVDATDTERQEIKHALIKSGEEKITGITELPIENGELKLGDEVLALIYSGDLYLSQSRLESYLRCPFNYFLRYNLGLSETERAELSSSVIGSFIHSILEDFFKEVRERGINAAQITDADKEAITARASKRYVSEYLGYGDTERTRVAISRLQRAAMPVIDGMCDELSACKFTPVRFELSTAGRAIDDAKPIIYEDEQKNKVIIRGKVDRVDTYKDGNNVYVRVIDYKTGAKEFSPDDMASGINMQMFLYLESIIKTQSAAFKQTIGANEDDELLPAGVIYAKTSIRDAVVKTADDNEAKIAARDLSVREGMVLDEEESLSAMNPRYTPLKYPENARNEKSNTKKKYTRDTWTDICKDIERAILDISGKMRAGYISASPQEIKGQNPCDRCDFHAICRRAK